MHHTPYSNETPYFLFHHKKEYTVFNSQLHVLQFQSFPVHILPLPKPHKRTVDDTNFHYR